MNTILKLRNITKEYNGKKVLNNINLNIESGTVYGFLGPNGAGKSTTIKIILGLIKNYTGEVEIFESTLKHNRCKILSKVGALVESPSYYDHLSAYNNLKVWADMKNVNHSEICKVLKMVNLYEDRNKKAGKFSLGMKQRLGIAQALINDPDFLILDEPTNGLDPMGIKEIRNLIISLAKDYNKTVLVSSHLLSEVELMVDNVGIINKGNLQSLKESYPSCNNLEDIFIKLVERK